MPNHWHMVLYPRAEGDLSKFLQGVTLTHTSVITPRPEPWDMAISTKADTSRSPSSQDSHFLGLVRYVERNAQRAGLVKRAEEWPWGSVYARLYGGEGQQGSAESRH